MPLTSSEGHTHGKCRLRQDGVWGRCPQWGVWATPHGLSFGADVYGSATKRGVWGVAPTSYLLARSVEKWLANIELAKPQP